MRSAAHFKGHPIHPMLVGFPITFIVSALACDVAGHFAGLPGLTTTAAWLGLAGIASGLLAAVPGIIDYYGAVPPRSSAKRRATWHGLVNSAALAALAAGWAFRDWQTFAPGWGTLVLEAVAAGLLGWGGWMGGTLSFRNQIGVDHRYAHAGRWREQTLGGDPADARPVPGAAELKPGQMMLLHAEGRRVVLARTDDGFAAFDDRCPHRGGSLAGGVLSGCVVTCPWHGSQFDCRSGEVKAGPAEQRITAYPVEQSGGEVRVRLPVVAN